jgi:hypothetical protein
MGVECGTTPLGEGVGVREGGLVCEEETKGERGVGGEGLALFACVRGAWEGACGEGMMETSRREDSRRGGAWACGGEGKGRELREVERTIS